MVDTDVELPKAQIKRIVLGKLPPGPDNKPVALSKDALAAFSESAKVFISYISTTANDICKEAKRQTINADDVVKAVEELEFSSLLPQLKEYHETYKKLVKERNQKRSEVSKASKKRRTEKAEAEGGKGAEGGAEGEAAEAAAAGEQPAQGAEEEAMDE